MLLPMSDEVPSSRLLETLLASRPRFLAHVRRQIRDEALAEDVLQDALARAYERIGELRTEEALNGWFYRLLDNAVLDHHRRSSTRTRALESLALEPEGEKASPDDTPRKCKCVTKLAADLKPEYSRALQRLEIDEIGVKEFAEEEDVSRGNAAVRAFRARETLRSRVVATCGACAANGCQDCSCHD